MNSLGQPVIRRTKVLRTLESGPKTVREVYEILNGKSPDEAAASVRGTPFSFSHGGPPYNCVSNDLATALRGSGYVRRVKHGTWELTNEGREFLKTLAPSDGNREFLEGVTGIVEATGHEYMNLWEKYGKLYGWEGDLSSRLIQVGQIYWRPICISLRKATVKGQKVMFWHATSELVDYRMVNEWMKDNLPPSAFLGDLADRRINSVTAGNFSNVLRRPSECTPVLGHDSKAEKGVVGESGTNAGHHGGGSVI